MFCTPTISVYILMLRRLSALNLQSVLAREKDIEALVLKPDNLSNLEAIIRFSPDVVITDEATFSLLSADALRQIKDGATRFLFLSPAESDGGGVPSPEADGVISASSPAELLAVAIRSLAAGRSWVDETPLSSPAEQTTADSDSATSEAGVARLSYREIEVLRLAAEGFNNREIARAMNLSHDIIKACMWLIFRKLRARGRVQAVSVARKCGMFS